MRTSWTRFGTVAGRAIPGVVAGRLAAVLVILVALSLILAQAQQNGQQSANSQPQAQPSADRAWTTSGVVGFTNPQTEKGNSEAVNEERKKQLSEDSAKLLKLATDLKTEVDKTTKDTLSISVIRKADQIEKLAHSVKEKMRVAPGGN